MPNSKPEFEIGMCTDAGNKRRQEPNQDSIHFNLYNDDDGKTLLLIVADGMGGYQGGAEASRIVVETISNIFGNDRRSSVYEKLLPDCLHFAHQALIKYASEHQDLNRMGSTAVAAAIKGNQLYIVNIGDSRAYIIRGQEMLQLSLDHTIVGEKVRAGLLTNLEALRHPARNRLTQSLNVQRKNITPFYTRMDILPNDKLLLCSDGLWGVVSEAIIQAVVGELHPQEAADKLVSLANACQGPDNISAIVVQFIFAEE